MQEGWGFPPGGGGGGQGGREANAHLQPGQPGLTPGARGEGSHTKRGEPEHQTAPQAWPAAVGRCCCGCHQLAAWLSRAGPGVRAHQLCSAWRARASAVAQPPSAGLVAAACSRHHAAMPALVVVEFQEPPLLQLVCGGGGGGGRQAQRQLSGQRAGACGRRPAGRCVAVGCRLWQPPS